MNAPRFAVLLVSVTLAGCSEGSDSSQTGLTGATITSAGVSTGSEGGDACAPGMQTACPCIGGTQGVQVCLPDGTGFGPCEGCPMDTGDDSESSGATSTSTTAPTTTAPITTASTGTSDATSTGTTGDPVACPGGPGEIDLQQALLHDNPPDLANWPVTTSLTKVDFTADGVHVEFDKLDGPDRWPDIVPPDWDGPLQYTLGMAECIDGQWHASAAIQFWYGLYASGGNVALDDQVAVNWYYDAGRWGELAGRQPATGETIGIFVVAGNARAVHEDTPLQSPVMERSNVVLVPMPDVNGASHSF